MASVFERDGRWMAKYRDERGLWATRSCGQADKQTAKRLAAAWEGEALDRHEGRVDPKAELYRDAEARPISGHVEAFRAMLTGKNNTAEHVKETVAHVKRIIEAVGAVRLSDLTPEAVRNALAAIRANGRSLRTCNAILVSLKAFSNFLHADGRTRHAELAHLRTANIETDRRRVRRALTQEEIGYLTRAAEQGPTWGGIGGCDRSMLYLAASGSGLRAGELASLTAASFNLEAAPPTITVEAGYSKRRRRDVQPIHVALAKKLGAWLATRPKKRPVFRVPSHAAEMVRFDLRRARTAWVREIQDRRERRQRLDTDFLADVDSEGRKVDFHTFRHSYVSMVVDSGASVKVCQELARHSTPTLTIGLYAHARLHDLHAALPDVTTDGPDPEAVPMRAVGTYDHRPISSAPPAHQTGRNSQPRITKHGESATEDSQNADSRKPLPRADISNAPRQIARHCATTPGGTRTHDRRIRNPVLCPTELPALANRWIVPHDVQGCPPASGFCRSPLGAARTLSPGLDHSGDPVNRPGRRRVLALHVKVPRRLGRCLRVLVSLVLALATPVSPEAWCSVDHRATGPPPSRRGAGVR